MTPTTKTVTVQNVRNLIADIHSFVVTGRMDTREYVAHLQAVRDAIIAERKLKTDNYKNLVGKTQLRKESKAAFAAMRDWAIAHTNPFWHAPAVA